MNDSVQVPSVQRRRQPFTMTLKCYAVYLKAVFLLVVYHAWFSSCSVTKDELPFELQDCYNSYSGVSLGQVVGQSLCWSCEAPGIRRLRTSKQPSSMTSSGLEYVNDLIKIANTRYRRRWKRQTGGRCVRKEYRVMTDIERENFHTAINTLKNDTSVSPSKYDALAGLHTGDAIRPAHRGPNFPGWHRVYLILLEAALQEVDPSVCLPYWDSSLDNELEEPSLSYVFSPDFMGGGEANGRVSDGPFANWVTPNDGPLIRNIGVSGQLYSLTAITNILSQRRHRDISPPLGAPQNGLEFHHNGVHSFIGGQMNNLNAAAYDPAFFLHHCFVDYLWEVFRTNQRLRGEIDPENDYPDNFGSDFHNPNRTMGFGLNITAKQGYFNNLTDSYVYDPSPSCPECAGSRYLQCVNGRCLPVVPPPTTTPTPSSTTTTSTTSTTITTPGTPSTTTPNPGCPTTTPKPCKKYPHGNQNTFCCDGVRDTRGWVYVPVEIVSKRSPYLSGYDSYPVYNGSIYQTQDIYSPAQYEEMREFMPTGKPKGYEKCKEGNGVGQIFVQSSGLSYNGFYKESAIIDQRLATSIAIAYVAVKDPKNGPVKALFRAFDSCGRICHTSCKNPKTQEYEACSGVLNIKDTPGRPQQYSHTYGQATLNTWTYRGNRDCPRLREDDIVLSFYCDYGDRIPWVDPTVKPTTTTTPRPTTVQQNTCRVDKDCIIDVPCTVDNEWQCRARRQRCRGTCNMYAVCYYGTYIKRKCPRNWSFDRRRGTCTSRRLCSANGRKSTRYPKRKLTTPLPHRPYRPYR